MAGMGALLPAGRACRGHATNERLDLGRAPAVDARADPRRTRVVIDRCRRCRRSRCPRSRFPTAVGDPDLVRIARPPGAIGLVDGAESGQSTAARGAFRLRPVVVLRLGHVHQVRAAVGARQVGPGLRAGVLGSGARWVAGVLARWIVVPAAIRTRSGKRNVPIAAGGWLDPAGH